MCIWYQCLGGGVGLVRVSDMGGKESAPIHRPKHNTYTSRTGRHMGWTFYQHVPGGTGVTACHVTPTQYPNFFSLSLWREYSQVLVIKHSWSTTSRPFSWAKAITGAWVDGSSKKARNTSGLCWWSPGSEEGAEDAPGGRQSSGLRQQQW